MTFTIGDIVVIKHHGRDYGKMCDVIDVQDSMIRIRVINPHDGFLEGYNIIFGITEKWINPEGLSLAERQ